MVTVLSLLVFGMIALASSNPEAVSSVMDAATGTVKPWWFWPLVLFVLSFVLGIFVEVDVAQIHVGIGRCRGKNNAIASSGTCPSSLSIFINALSVGDGAIQFIRIFL